VATNTKPQRAPSGLRRKEERLAASKEGRAQNGG